MLLCGSQWVERSNAADTHHQKLGVLAWRIDAANYEKGASCHTHTGVHGVMDRRSQCFKNPHAEGKLAGIRAERHYKNHDFVESRKIPDLKSKLDTFKVPYTLCACVEE